MTVRKQGRRSAQDAEKTRLLILNVAKDLFCEFGYSKVSLRNISDKAGISHSLIRHHFGSKEQIWNCISDMIHDFMEQYAKIILENLSSNLAINERLYQFIVRMLAFNLLHPQPIKLMADVVREEGERYDYYRDKTGRLESVILSMVDEYNQRTQSDIEIAEVKWQLIMHAHSAASMAPFMRETWQTTTSDPEKCLLLHWQLFNDLMCFKFAIPSSGILQPDALQDLVYPCDLICNSLNSVIES